MKREPPDHQAKLVYDAEVALESWNHTIADHDEAIEFVTNVMNLPLIHDKYRTPLRKLVDVGIRAPHATTSLGGEDGMYIAPCHLRQVTVLHELSHVIQFRKYKKYRFPGHGWTFTSIYLDVVRAALGKKAHATLLKSFIDHEVKYLPEPLTKLQNDRKIRL